MQWNAKSRWAQGKWQICAWQAEGSSDLARDSARLQETLMDGVLQKLLVVVGHGCVPAASSTLVTDRHLKHWRTHLKRRQCWTDEKPKEKQVKNHRRATILIHSHVWWWKLAAFPPAASSSSPEDVGVAAGVVFASSSVLHLLTFPNVILAFSTWNRGISARE